MKTEKIKVKPLSDRVIIDPVEVNDRSAGGIIIPDAAKEKSQKGKVMATGPGNPDEPMTVKVNDQVLYGKYSGTDITINEKDYLIMSESDIFAII